jgi:chorismate mutase
MDPLSHLRGMIASLDETLVDSLCARARLGRNDRLYALPGAPSSSPDLLAGPFAASTTPAGRAQVLRPSYLRLLLPALCGPGNEDDRSACLAADAACLDALARRLALSVHVATRKREAIPEALQIAIRTGDPARVEDAITNPAVEADVLARVRLRARERAPRMETPDQIAALYAEWIIPLSRKIQVHGLLATS